MGFRRRDWRGGEEAAPRVPMSGTGTGWVEAASLEDDVRDGKARRWCVSGGYTSSAVEGLRPGPGVGAACGFPMLICSGGRNSITHCIA